MAVAGSLSMRAFWALAAERERAGHLGRFRQGLEAAILYACRGVGPGYYQMAGFWEKGVPWRDKAGHLSTMAYRKALQRLNPVNHRKISQNKLIEKALLQALAIPTPPYLGFYHPAAGRTPDGAPLRTPEALSEYLSERLNGKKVCFKAVEGWGGYTFESVAVAQDGDDIRLLRDRTGEYATVSEFCDSALHTAHARGSILETYLQQHDAFAAFNLSSVNTLRIWALQAKDLTVTPVLAYLRIGRLGAIVDNQSSGGIVAPVNLQTGILEPAMDGTPRRQIYPMHPDHAAPIADVKLPFFEESLSLATSCVAAFPGTRFAGVDVAVTPEGPSVIELNVSPDRIGAAFTRVPTRAIARS
ncbi:sugar-transfer associated ATP-grasp domain-containing protein [Spiribacter halobius]|nr:sugar-transfer associated ATP-grasp domain-containing protein [Spiribacter halobius]UEX77323.1 hypothetical protein LMH63_15450 [Spiribacter halobius]